MNINWDIPRTDALRADQAGETGVANLAHQCSPKDINASGSKSNRRYETISLIKVTLQLVELGELLNF